MVMGPDLTPNRREAVEFAEVLLHQPMLGLSP
jgi:hypothetical protein